MSSRQQALSVPFAEDLDEAPVHIEVGDRQAAQFGHAHTGSVHQLQNRSVTNVARLSADDPVDHLSDFGR